MSEVVVDWCIEAKVKGKGRPLRHETMGSAADATAQMASWLESLINTGKVGGTPRVMLEAELTSEQLPGWRHEVSSCIEGMPADAAIEYSVEWLVTVAEMDNWGGGGGP